MLYLISSIIFCSSVFWMKDTVDYFSWTIFEMSATLLLIHLILKKKILLPEKKQFLPILLFILWSACSLFWTQNFHATLTALYKIFFSLFILILFINENLKWESSLRRTIIFISILVTLFYFLNSIYSLSDFFLMSHPNLFSSFLASGAVLVTNQIFKTKGWKQWLYLSFSILMPMTILLIGSLGPLLVWGFGTIALFLLLYRKKIYILGIGLCLIFLLSILQNSFSTLWKRKMTDPYTQERAQIWKDGLSYLIYYPLKGSGLGTFRDHYPQFKQIEGFRNAPYAHNELLNFLCELGTVGFIILLLIIKSLMSPLKGTRELFQNQEEWLAILIGLGIQSLFDFNLHYPPLLLIMIFSISKIFKTREAQINNRSTKIFCISGISILGILFSLPGIADFIFRKAYPNLEERKKAAAFALKIDPFNALYRSETGLARDLLIAIDLEPRNVWYHRKAAAFFFQEWQKTKNKLYYQAAVEEYKIIFHLAPNVLKFKIEAEQFFSLKIENIRD
ncbi:MAG: O-antigen ligase family protein [Elusimicrobia bacterium]|nr:O-antigen ligase family protein [Elusimicrobiota bacterium]